MPKKNDLIEKISRKPIPKNFTKRELDILMNLIRELNYMVTRLRRQYSF